VIIWLLISFAVLLTARRVFSGYPKGAEEYSVLAPREVEFISSVSEVMFPAGGAIPFSGLDARIPRYADRFLAALEPPQRLEIRVLFAVFEHATLFFPGPGWNGFRRFSSLDLEQREVAMQGWSQSSVFLRQMIFTALRAVLTMGYLGHPTVMSHLRVAPLDFETPICDADLIFTEIGAHPDDNPLRDAETTPPSTGIPLDIEGPAHPDYPPSIVREEGVAE
jgi:hypothetical protein